MCHMSRVTIKKKKIYKVVDERMFTPHHVSHVTCHNNYYNFFSLKVVELGGGGSVIKGAYPV